MFNTLPRKNILRSNTLQQPQVQLPSGNTKVGTSSDPNEHSGGS